MAPLPGQWDLVGIRRRHSFCSVSGYKFLKINFYWNIVALQCCVKFLLYGKVNQLYVCIKPLFFGFPSHFRDLRALGRVLCATGKLKFLMGLNFAQSVNIDFECGDVTVSRIT